MHFLFFFFLSTLWSSKGKLPDGNREGEFNKDARTQETATESASSTNNNANNGKDDGIVTEQSENRKLTQKPIEGDATQKPVEGGATQKQVEDGATQKPVEGGSTQKITEGGVSQKPVDDQTKTTKRAVSIFKQSVLLRIQNGNRVSLWPRYTMVVTVVLTIMHGRFNCCFFRFGVIIRRFCNIFAACLTLD